MSREIGVSGDPFFQSEVWDEWKQLYFQNQQMYEDGLWNPTIRSKFPNN